MSTLSFKAFCIEYYAAHIGRPSNEVYALFEQTGLLNLLDEDYEDLHGMSMEYLMQFFENARLRNLHRTSVIQNHAAHSQI